MILDNWVFFDEQQEDGNMVRFAKNLSDMKVYRWEPLTTRLLGYEAGPFKKAVAQRNKLLRQFNTGDLGIVPVIGPLFYQERFWLGWEAFAGENLFTQFKKRCVTTAQTATELYPLIRSYFHYHQAGLLVGRPDWNRLFRNHQGLYMIDPAYLSYLATPVFDLPSGLVACRNPETFNGGELDNSGDLFYLGLLIYLSFTGKLPYPLINQWPTKALLKGEIIPVVMDCPDLSPRLAEMIGNLLNPNPAKRGTTEQLEAYWRLMLEQESYLANPKTLPINLGNQKAFHRRCWLQKVYKPALVITASFLLMLFIGRILLMPVQHSDAIPLQKVAEFYSIVAGPPQTAANVSLNQVACSDFNQTKRKRLQMANALLVHPLAKVERLRVVSRTPRRVVVEALLNLWDWNNGSWRSYQRHEKIVLQTKGTRWEVVNREL